ncbi:MAG: cation transporter [Methanophagales archaeon ANME-1-THS]|nr:MAG: cation transporter [Methanophagales archaeon ANME-1-THS]
MGTQTPKSVFSELLFEYHAVEKKRLILSLSITATVMVIEFIGGILTNSIALISDAGHMFTHSFALSISLIALFITCKPPCHHRTFGLYRAEILAAFINGLFLLLVVVVIIFEAVKRIIEPRVVLGLQMLLIALIGLAVNVASILILRGVKADLNIRSVFYHLIGDAASSLGVVAAAIVIFYTAWTIIDPLVSLGISALILFWAWGILKESTLVLLEMAPAGLNIEIIGNDLKSVFPEIEDLYNVHLWAITPDMLVFSAHVKVPNDMSLAHQDKLQATIAQYLAEKYNIIESTIQMASEYEAEVCRIPNLRRS